MKKLDILITAVLTITPAMVSASGLLKVGTPTFDGKYADIPVIIDTTEVKYVHCALLDEAGFPLGTQTIIADNRYDLVTIKLPSPKKIELVKGVDCSYRLR